MINTRTAVFLIIGAIGIAAAGWLFIRSQTTEPSFSIDASDTDLVALGQSLYAKHCASCHGAKLEGQPNWKERLPNGKLPAPPHDASGHTWHHSDQQLFDITKSGLGKFAGPDYQTDMPKFTGSLTDEEIRAVLAFIKSTWPERERAAQERIGKQTVE